MKMDNANSFFGHLDELAKRMKVVIFVFMAVLIVLLIIPGNLNFLADPNDYQPWVSILLRSIREQVLPSDVKLIAVGFTDPIELYALAAMIFAVALTLPVFTYELYKFIDPALYPSERKEVYPAVALVFLLFTAGGIFGYFFLFPFFIWSMFPFFTAVGAEMMFSIMDFYNILFFTILITGLVFTIPVFFVLLVKYGILRTDIFRKNRKYLYLGLIVATLFISPGASPQGNLFLFLPLAVLVEISLFVGRRYEKSGKIRHIDFFGDPKCKFCGQRLDESTAFCPGCRKAQS